MSTALGTSTDKVSTKFIHQIECIFMLNIIELFSNVKYKFTTLLNIPLNEIFANKDLGVNSDNAI